jgi:signal transduction histidine kinase
LVEQVTQLLDRILQTCKTLTWQLSPQSLYESNFVAGLERMAEDLKTLFDLNVVICPLEDRLELRQNLSALLFRCAKELLVNVAKHSESGTAEVQITRNGDHVCMKVIDRGKGFDTSGMEAGSAEGFGLFSMRERLIHIDGSIEVDSSPGRGTQVTIDVPLAALEPTPPAPGDG